MEGWQAWGLVEQLTPQVRTQFPLETALRLADALGYEVVAMAELLPAAAAAVTDALLARQLRA
ncbi:MAG: hypothetical protein DI628_03470 [Blastochloris viridis]|uniref:Uncharacterized protein n=1 Tax=Blastochloris viridis TaxID=1079 RepID=A0A6N4REL9_BLAVI|nr:MAG: hypothetical protein DI628_03470 [Blastochloris viridis]